MYREALKSLSKENVDQLLATIKAAFPSKAEDFDATVRACDEDHADPGDTFYELWLACGDWVKYGN